jgi:rod shape-determining protein MreD
MKLLGAFIVFVLCALAQAALAQVVPVYRLVRIDLCLIVLVAFALRADEERGFLLGVLAGLAVDLVGGGTLGVCALGYGAVGFLVGGVQETLFRGTVVLRGLLVLIVGAIGAVVIYGVLRLIEPRPGRFGELRQTLTFPLLATGLVAAAVLARIERRQLKGWRRD